MRSYMMASLTMLFSFVVMCNDIRPITTISIQFLRVGETVQKQLERLNELVQKRNIVQTEEQLVCSTKEAIECIREIGVLIAKTPEENECCFELQMQKRNGSVTMCIGQKAQEPIAEIRVACFVLEQKNKNELNALLQDMYDKDETSMIDIVNRLYGIADRMLKNPQSNRADIDLSFPKKGVNESGSVQAQLHIELWGLNKTGYKAMLQFLCDIGSKEDQDELEFVGFMEKFIPQLRTVKGISHGNASFQLDFPQTINQQALSAFRTKLKQYKKSLPRQEEFLEALSSFMADCYNARSEVVIQEQDMALWCNAPMNSLQCLVEKKPDAAYRAIEALDTLLEKYSAIA